ncbi:lysosomal proton-coupled steroid conjugate and bile acid symporter SLC46A3 [Halyomorpha halys]|uniref:lysosomal proton-coupled steroid conjugate and bile acid symporter SLC46A3 n=1 Tax=Halyomorpha halys TaxID=286706 RepID=UPI0006D51F86|nr:solute carrier family 46 member 3-like [Halyomorpha halys]
MKASDYFRGITVEPSIFLNALALAFSTLTVQNLLVQKTCYPDVQPPIALLCNDSDKVGAATDIVFARSTLRSVLSAIAVPLLGSWRDATGKNRLLTYLALISEMVVAFMYLLTAWSWSISPWIASLIDAILGGICGENILHLTATCVITENSKPEDRTLRIQLNVVATLLGAGIGAAVNGFILTPMGYQWFFFLIILLNLIALIFAIIFVKDPKRDMTIKSKCIFFEKLNYVFQARPNNSVIWTMLICASLAGTFQSAENNLLLYYLQQGFQFTMIETGLFGSYKLSICVLGAVIMTPVFMKILKWSDFKIGIICSFFTVISSLLMIGVKTRVQLYLFALLDVLKMIPMSLPKSIISKCVPSDELGSFLGVGSVLGIFLPFLVNNLYNKIFSDTSSTLPGAFFIISACGNFVVLILYSLSSCLFKDPLAKLEKTDSFMDVGKWKRFDSEDKYRRF